MEKKKGLSILIGCLMFLTCFFSFGAVNPKKASAAHPNYIGQDCIYYFCDVYPSLDSDSSAEVNGSDLDLLIDRQPIDDQEFTTLVNNGYFSNIYDCIVVLDFKHFIPTLLDSLVDDLKDNDCTVILVTAEFYEFDSTLLNIDEHYESDLGRFDAFIRNALIDMTINGAQTQDIQILVDGNFMTNDHICYDDGSAVDCPFATILFDRFIGSFNFSNTNITPHATFLLYKEGNYFDLITGSLSSIDYNKPTYALGCWAMDSVFYNDLITFKNSGLLQGCYVMEGDPFTYSNSGLICLDEWQLAAMYGYEADESTDVRNLLYPYI